MTDMRPVMWALAAAGLMFLLFGVVGPQSLTVAAWFALLAGLVVFFGFAMVNGRRR